MGGRRRKGGCGRFTSRGGADLGRLTAQERASLDRIFEPILDTAPNDLTDGLPAVVPEMWGSRLWSTLSDSELGGGDPIGAVAGELIAYAGRRATPGALMVLRALGAVAPAPYGPKARRTADRLAAHGVDERPWAAMVGVWEPTVAWLSFDPVDDDGVSVMVGFEGATAPSTVGIYVDHNLGGMAKDAFVVPAGIEEVLTGLRELGDGEDGPSFAELGLDEAAARWRAALATTDLYMDPPSTEDFDHLRALISARLAMLPRSGGLPRPVELGDDERDELLSAFLGSDETIGLAGPEGEEAETLEDLSEQVLTFALDQVVGQPLRFSPVMVEMFCLDWAPRKIAMDGDAFTLLPDVLAAWIRFVGRRRGIPGPSVAEAVAAVFEHAPEMIELAQDPDEWGPAKTMALAIRQRGVDLTDQAALDDFVDEVNREGGIDVLADSLAGYVAPKR